MLEQFLTYEPQEWLLFFYIYCFFGWVFESTYVSICKRRFVNRGFLRLPMLPLYGTGAIMMLWVSIPVKDNLFLTFLAGSIGATILEYVVGISMEAIFKVKYWDYSKQKFNFQGVICLSSSIAWGFLTILLTRVIHKPVEQLVFSLSAPVQWVIVGVVSVLFVSDTVASVKAALDLKYVLEQMSRIRTELESLQVQLALAKMEGKNYLKEMAENLGEKQGQFVAKQRERMEEIQSAVKEQWDAYNRAKERLGFYKKGLLKANPSATSRRFGSALKDLKESILDKRKK